MADTETTEYQFVKPEVGASTGSWGAKLNADMDDLDATIKTISDAADTTQDDLDILEAAALLKAGGTMSGPIANLTQYRVDQALDDVDFDLALARSFFVELSAGTATIDFDNVPPGLVEIILRFYIPAGATFVWPAGVLWDKSLHPSGELSAVFASPSSQFIVRMFTDDSGTGWVANWYEVAA